MQSDDRMERVVFIQLHNICAHCRVITRPLEKCALGKHDKVGSSSLSCNSGGNNRNDASQWICRECHVRTCRVCVYCGKCDHYPDRARKGDNAEATSPDTSPGPSSPPCPFWNEKREDLPCEFQSAPNKLYSRAQLTAYFQKTCSSVSYHPRRHLSKRHRRIEATPPTSSLIDRKDDDSEDDVQHCKRRCRAAAYPRTRLFYDDDIDDNDKCIEQDDECINDVIDVCN